MMWMSRSEGNSRFPGGMTERKAKARGPGLKPKFFGGTLQGAEATY
jgi:hypothetical protein